MTGLEKMVSQILEEANAAADAKMKDTAGQVEEIRVKAQEEADRLTDEMAQRSKVEIANYKERVKSSADLKRRTELLSAKQEIIAETIAKAYDAFCNKEDGDYFATLKKMLEKFARSEVGTIFLSAEDLKKVPADFETEIAKIAKAKGGELTLSREAAKIDKGFILSYGGIEENCSFKAMFDSQKDDIQDLVQKILFS